MMKKVKALFVEEQGQGMTEYALVLGTVVVAVIAALALFGPKLGTLFNDVISKL
jgi:pilus assembly protein Flp/PilA